MPRKNSDPEAETARQTGLAPETFNDEQHDEDAQAQTLADEALGRSPADYGSPTESRKVNGKNYDEHSTQDLVDHMRDMERSGRIDMGAYEGEENMDDEDDKYGEATRPGDDPSFHDR